MLYAHVYFVTPDDEVILTYHNNDITIPTKGEHVMIDNDEYVVRDVRLNVETSGGSVDYSTFVYLVAEKDLFTDGQKVREKLLKQGFDKPY